MKLAEAQQAIKDSHGYLVHFEYCRDEMLRSDHFPDVRNGEEAFKTREEAIEIGNSFAEATKGKTCNFYLIRSDNFAPIGNWKINWQLEN